MSQPRETSPTESIIASSNNKQKEKKDESTTSSNKQKDKKDEPDEDSPGEKIKEVNVFREPSIVPSRLRQRRNSQSGNPGLGTASGNSGKTNNKRISRPGRGHGRGKGHTTKGITKGKNRRTAVFKKMQPTKAPSAVATTVTADNVFYKGSYFRIGDIVSMLDADDNVYYAQIRGFLQDQYCEKSAVITWLLPSDQSPPPNEKFDASTYIIGHEEDLPRRLSCMEFVMHAPSDYFKDESSPYAVASCHRYQTSIINTTMGVIIRSEDSALQDD